MSDLKVLFRITAALALLAAGCGSRDSGREAPDGGESCFCGSDAPPPAPPLASGDYQLTITNRFFWSAGPELHLAEDGSFTGHAEETLWGCAGTMTAEELAVLTAALNDAHVLDVPDHPQDCADHPIYDIAIVATGGAASGMQNSFTYEVCTESLPAIDAVIAAAMAPVRALDTAGACNLCPPVTEEGCYGVAGDHRICIGEEPHDCDESHADETVECRETLRCDPLQGWVGASE
jgi:hypothetical protein